MPPDTEEFKDWTTLVARVDERTLAMSKTADRFDAILEDLPCRDHAERIGRVEGRQNGAPKPSSPPSQPRDGFGIYLSLKAIVALTTVLTALAGLATVWAKAGFPLP